MKKRIFKKVLSIVLVCVMVLTSMGAYSRTAMASEAEVNFAELVSVVIYETKDQILTAYVEADTVAEFTYRLENEIGYRETQIEKTSSVISPQTRCLKPSNGSLLSSSTRMDIDGIISFIESRQAAAQSYLDDMSSSIPQMLLLFANLLGYTLPPIGLILTVVTGVSGIFASEVASKPDPWWELSLHQIITGEIIAVCRCIYINTASDYPKAWVLVSKVY